MSVVRLAAIREQFQSFLRLYIALRLAPASAAAAAAAVRSVRSEIAAGDMLPRPHSASSTRASSPAPSARGRTGADGAARCTSARRPRSLPPPPPATPPPPSPPPPPPVALCLGSRERGTTSVDADGRAAAAATNGRLAGGGGLAGAWYRDFLGRFARVARRDGEGERTRLDLGGAGLGRLPVEAGLLLSPCVGHLALSRNRLGRLPDDLAGWGRLQALRLDFNRLEALPGRFGAECEGLVELNLTGNRLAGLPDSLSRLTALTALLLSSNRLPALPAAVAGCTALTRLAARDNRLECVRAAGALARLRALLLGQNAGLRHVAAEVGRCGALETLELDPAVAFPPPHMRAAGVAAALAHLRLVLAARETGRLDMAGLGLARVAPPVCREAGLTALDLSRNRLAGLPPELAKLAGLTRLVAAHNQVRAGRVRAGRVRAERERRARVQGVGRGEGAASLWCW